MGLGPPVCLDHHRTYRYNTETQEWRCPCIGCDSKNKSWLLCVDKKEYDFILASDRISDEIDRLYPIVMKMREEDGGIWPDHTGPGE